MELATSEIVSKDADGTTKAGFTYTGLNSNAVADNLLNNAGTAGVRANGEAFGDSLVINTTAAVGGACPTNNAMVWGNGTNTLRLLKCVANVWAATGATVGAAGGVCPVNDEIGETTTKASIICVGNVWQSTTSRMGKWSIAYTVPVVHGSVVAKPTCGSGGLARLVEVPQAIDAKNLYTNFGQNDNGGSWTVQLTDGAGAGTLSGALATGGCWYN